MAHIHVNVHVSEKHKFMKNTSMKNNDSSSNFSDNLHSTKTGKCEQNHPTIVTKRNKIKESTSTEYRPTSATIWQIISQTSSKRY